MQTQINNKVAKSGDVMTGSLTLPSGSANSPSLQFSESTNTGISAPNSNTISFDANGRFATYIYSASVNTWYCL